MAAAGSASPEANTAKPGSGAWSASPETAGGGPLIAQISSSPRTSGPLFGSYKGTTLYSQRTPGGTEKSLQNVGVSTWDVAARISQLPPASASRRDTSHPAGIRLSPLTNGVCRHFRCTRSCSTCTACRPKAWKVSRSTIVTWVAAGVPSAAFEGLESSSENCSSDSTSPSLRSSIDGVGAVVSPGSKRSTPDRAGKSSPGTAVPATVWYETSTASALGSDSATSKLT